MSYQQITLIGNLGRDPEMRYLDSGTAVTNISVATSNKYKNKAGELISETTWFKVAVWGNNAEAVNQYLKKGSKVLVVGRMKPDANGNPAVFETQNGHGASFEVTADKVTFLDSKSDGENNQQSAKDVQEPAF